MPVKNHQRIILIWIFFEAFRQKYMSAQVHISSPKLRKFFRFEFDMLHVFGVFRSLDFRDDLIDCQLQFLAFFPGNGLRLGVNIFGSACPLTAFALIHWEFDGMAVSAGKRVVLLDESLYIIVSICQIFQFFDWVAKAFRIQNQGFSCFEIFKIHPENLIRFHIITDSKSRFSSAVGRKNQEKTAVFKFGLKLRSNVNFDFFGWRAGPKQSNGK